MKRAIKLINAATIQPEKTFELNVCVFKNHVNVTDTNRTRMNPLNRHLHLTLQTDPELSTTPSNLNMKLIDGAQAQFTAESVCHVNNWKTITGSI